MNVEDWLCKYFADKPVQRHMFQELIDAIMNDLRDGDI